MWYTILIVSPDSYKDLSKCVHGPVHDTLWFDKKKTYIKMIDYKILTFNENFGDECIETNNFE